MTPLLRRSNIVASAVLALLGAGAAYGGSTYGLFREGGLIGPGFLPAICGVVILVLGLIDLVLQILQKPAVETVGDEIVESIIEDAPMTTDRLQVASDLDIFGRDQKTRNRQLITVIAALLIAMLLVPVLGLILALAALMLFVSIFVEKRGVIASVLVTAVTIAVFYLVFVVFLGVPMPLSIFGVI